MPDWRTVLSVVVMAPVVPLLVAVWLVSLWAGSVTLVAKDGWRRGME